MINNLIKNYFDENEMFELEGIFEKSSDPICLIQINIKYAIEQILQKKVVQKIEPFYNEEYAGDNSSIIAMGNYKVLF